LLGKNNLVLNNLYQEHSMDQNAISAEISAQSEIVDSISITQSMVTEIDRHLKVQEYNLNEKLIHFTTRLMLKDFLTEIPIHHMVTKVDDEMWNSLRFVKSIRNKSPYEEISYEKSTKGFGFFYRSGEVTYDLGFYNGPVGMECYYRIIEDKREIVKVTGAPVEIKFRAFRNLKQLLSMIANQANHVASIFHNEQSGVDGNRDLSRVKVDLAEVAPLGQMEAIRHLTSR
jgi:hypothetical protein